MYTAIYKRQNVKRYNCHNPEGIKLSTILSARVNHLCKPTFKHSFRDTL